MKRIDIKATEQTPRVLLDKDQGTFLMEGFSFPDTPIIFYSGIVEWFKEYSQSPNEETKLVCSFLYMNSTSTKFIHDILKKLDALLASGKKASVTWIVHPDDEDIEQVGLELKSLHTIPFEMVMTKEDKPGQDNKKFF